MVVAASASILDGVGSMKLAISQEGLRSLLTQVETELHRSEVYQSALAGLQHEGTDAFNGSQALKTVGREAIRLALRHLAKHHLNHSVTPVGVAHSTISSRPMGSTAQTEPVQATEVIEKPTIVHSSVSGSPSGITLAAPATPIRSARTELRIVSQTPRQPTLRPVKSGARVEAAPSPAEQKRAAVLRQIGMELGQTRQGKGVSLERLHTQTWIPIHLIRALEVGDIDRLPEDIYIRGFIRRIADALGLDGMAMASSLTVLDQPKPVVASWQQRSPEPPTLRPVHLYLSYAALMAGALGGLAWSYQSDAPQLVDPGLPEPQPAEAAQSPIPSVGASSTPSTTSTGGAIANPEVTLPETSRPQASR